MKNMEKYPCLTYFLRAYFNQDFDLIFGTPDETIAAYKSEETQEQQSRMKAEIEQLIALNHQEEELQNILLNELDCSYYYLSDWDSSELWLRHMYEQLS